MDRRRLVAALGIVIVAMLLMGCALITEIAGGNAQEKPTTAAPTPTVRSADDGDPDASGHWEGSLTFSDFQIHSEDEQTQLLVADDIAEMMDKSFPIMLEVDPSMTQATLDFDGTLEIPGAMSCTGDTVTFEFRKAGTGTFEAGATLPITFTLTGESTGGAQPGMAGEVSYDVFTMDGAPAWTQMGTWSVGR